MYIGSIYIRMSVGSPVTYYSPTFPRGGLSALFGIEVFALMGSSPTLECTVEHKNEEDTSFATAGTFSSMTTTGLKTQDVSSLKEQVRLEGTSDFTTKPSNPQTDTDCEWLFRDRPYASSGTWGLVDITWEYVGVILDRCRFYTIVDMRWFSWSYPSAQVKTSDMEGKSRSTQPWPSESPKDRWKAKK